MAEGVQRALLARPLEHGDGWLDLQALLRGILGGVVSDGSRQCSPFGRDEDCLMV